MTVTHAVGRASYVRWKVLGLIVLASSIAYVLRSSISVLAPYISDDLDVSLVQLGVVMSAFSLGYAIFQFPGGLLGDRIGARKAMTLIALCSGVLAVCNWLTPGGISATAIVTYLAVVWFLIGSTQAPLFPVLTAGAVANWFPIGGWGVPNGLSSFGLGMGAAVTAPLFVWMIDAWGWREACLAISPLFLLLAAAWWWYVRDYPSQHKSVSQQELELIDEGRLPPDDQVHPGVWKKVLKDRNILLITIAYFLSNYVFYTFMWWFFSYLIKDGGFDEKAASFFNAGNWIIGSVGALIGGFVFDWSIKQWGLRSGGKSVPAIALLVCAVLLLLSQYVTQPMVVIVMLSFAYALQQLTEAPFWGATIAVSGRHAAAAGGVMNTGGNIPGILVGLSSPLLAQYFGWSSVIVSCAVVAIVAAIIWMYIRIDEPMEDAGF